MNPVIIFIFGAEGMEPINAFLKSCDVDALGGRGTFEFTHDVSEAMTFETSAAAFRYYTRQSSVQPFRDDGEPNRPLTAFTIEIAPPSAFTTYRKVEGDAAQRRH